MEKKCLSFSDGLGINDSRASPYCISAILNLNKKFGINFNGEAKKMTDKDREIIMSTRCNNFNANIAEVDTPP